MKDIKQLFEEIGKNDIDENCNNFLEDGIIDSIAIMALVGVIEDKYNIEVDFDYMTPENFKNFWTIRDIILKIINQVDCENE
ncbi:acyl carrier protein [Campylobacter jejuni]|nr:acyl carrier protein [Campylobacter jejuni]ECR1616860.1 acyl carrier protein [Campylobacter jejuni]